MVEFTLKASQFEEFLCTSSSSSCSIVLLVPVSAGEMERSASVSVRNPTSAPLQMNAVISTEGRKTVCSNTIHVYLPEQIHRRCTRRSSISDGGERDRHCKQ